MAVNRTAARYVPLGLLLALACLAVVLVVKANRQAHVNAALVQAVNAQDAARVGVLLAEGADANTRDETGRPPLPWYWSILHTLHLPKKAAPAPYLGPTVLMLAADNGDAKTANFLLAHGADVNRAGADPDHPKYYPSCLPLDEAVAGKYWPVKYTPLKSQAADRRRLVITNLLLDRGASANSACHEANCTPDYALVGAALLGSDDAALLLLHHGADPNVASMGEPLLNDVLYWDDVTLAKALIHHGANVNAVDKAGKTPLLIIAGKPNMEFLHEDNLMVHTLIVSGADVNAQDLSGDTALMSAVSADNYQQTQSLVYAGANVNIKNNTGHTALSLAMNFPADARLIKLLKSAGAKE